MRVAFDEQIFLLQERGGASRSFVETINRFDAMPELGVEPVLPFRRVWSRHALEGLAGMRRGIPVKEPYPQLAWAMLRPRHRQSVDLVHHTFYHRRFLRDFPGAPKAVSVYDMIPERMPEAVRPGVHMAKADYVAAADLVICISESARDDLLEFYEPPRRDPVVVHLGVDDEFLGGGPPVAGFPEQYLLFIGLRSGYKDFGVLREAFTVLAGDYPDLHLMVVGGGPFTAAEAAAIDDSGFGSRVRQQSLADWEMPGAYGNAAAFVFPSRYEGFGLPAVEAMAAGAPAVLADSSSLPEVGGDAALYFPPGSSAGLTAVLASVLEEPALRERMVRRGRERARRFTWAETARKTAAAYADVLS